jgi:hypothetical protein
MAALVKIDDQMQCRHQTPQHGFVPTSILLRLARSTSGSGTG